MPKTIDEILTELVCGCVNCDACRIDGKEECKECEKRQDQAIQTAKEER